MVANALSRRYNLFNSCKKNLDFEPIKELYRDDTYFITIYVVLRKKKKVVNDYYVFDEFLFKKSRLCIPKWFIRDLLVKEAHSSLMEHFGINKTYDRLHEHFF